MKRRAATPPDGASSPRKHSFPPVTDERTRVLILGSLPGERSLAASRYYAHPQNQFWRLAGAVIGTDLAAAEYPVRMQRLLAAGVGLWDVVASARRMGSLDVAIEDVAPNDLGKLVGELPDLRAIGFNGGTASRIGRRTMEIRQSCELVSLPSSSPANTVPFASKLAAWLPLTCFLEQPAVMRVGAGEHHGG